MLKTIALAGALHGIFTVSIPYAIVRLSSHIAWTRFELGWARWGGLVLGLFGGYLYVHSVVRLLGRRTSAIPGQRPAVLETAGWYGVVRHPLLLGVIAILAGEAVYFQSFALGAYALGYWIWLDRFVALREEPDLHEVFGAAYAAYCGRVPRWLPALPIPRVHAMELEDQAWFPRSWREAGMALLRFCAENLGQATNMRSFVESSLEKSRESEILDLCSGAGGPIVSIARALRASGRDVRITMTDLYPSDPARARVAASGDPNLSYEPSPIDATSVPATRPGLRTMFNAFHHFRPQEATAILASAVAARRPILIVEVLQRRLTALLGMLLVPLLVLCIVPLVRPLRIWWLVFTYAIPVIPLFVLWDGTISILRAYDADELMAMASKADPANDFEWTVRQIPMSPSPVAGICLFGVPKAEPDNGST